MRIDYGKFDQVPAAAWRWPDFTPRELACRGTGKLVVDTEALDRLQALRRAIGRPMVINSAYRSPEHNTAVGGAPRSLHMRALAFDVRMDNHDPAAFEAAAREAGFTGFGFYPRQGFMHIDIGPARTWGDRFPDTPTGLAPDQQQPRERASAAQSTTVQASAVQLVTVAAGAPTAIAALEGTAQIVALAILGVLAIGAIWIMRERLRKWAQGVR